MTHQLNTIYLLSFRCYPKLNEGDQVVMINGRDVSQHTHDQVVNFIRACSEPHSGQLVLAVRQVRLHTCLQGQFFSKLILHHGLLTCFASLLH